MKDEDDEDEDSGDEDEPTGSDGTEVKLCPRHPSESWIKFLLTQGTKEAKDDTWVAQQVVNMGFPIPSSEYLTTMRARVLALRPKVFKPKDRYHRESVKFLKSEGIYGLYNPDPAADEANQLTINLRARPLVESLLLGRLGAKEIATKVNKRLGTHLTGDGVEAYKQYYWNVDLLRVEEWAVLLEKFDMQRERILSILQCGAGYALHAAGFQQQLESKVILRDMMTAIHWDFQDWSRQPRSLDRTKAFGSLARAACTLDTQLSAQDAAIRESLKAFEKFRMEHAGKTVPDIKDVAPMGNFTGSGKKLLEVVPDPDPDDEELATGD